MKVTKREDLNEQQRKALLQIPRQARSWEKLSIIATAAEEVLSDPQHGRENFSTTFVAERINADWQALGLSKPASIGVIYRYFAGPIELMDFVWWWRSEHYLDPSTRPEPEQA